MEKTIGIFLTLIIIVTFFGANQLVYGQTINTTQPLIVVPQQVATQPQVQAVAQQVDTNTIMTAVGGLITLVVVPYITKRLSDKTKEAKVEAEEGHEQNEFRLKATAEAVKEMNNSLKATDKGNLEGFKIIQALFKPFKETENLKKAYDEITVEGVPVLDALDNYIRESQRDLEEYYNGENQKEDEFDTCNDPIVQKLALVRNKSKK